MHVICDINAPYYAQKKNRTSRRVLGPEEFEYIFVDVMRKLQALSKFFVDFPLLTLRS